MRNVSFSVKSIIRALIGGEWKKIAFYANAKLRGVDLDTAPLEAIGLSDERSLFYVNSGGPNLERILNTLLITGSDAAIDLGCGKGGAMLSLAKYPFSRVDGVELSKQLIAIANENFRRMGVRNCTIYHCDAADFQDLDPYTLAYMFHPFPEIVTKAVLENICQSMRRRPRRFRIVYQNPISHDVIVNSGFQRVAAFGGAHHETYVYMRDTVSS